jgi:2-polyprenyl-3-methyl-5-hydroxy-6-metoxy-1,4-benzoquinol methylase
MNIHTKHHNKGDDGRSKEIEGYIEQSVNWAVHHATQRGYDLKDLSVLDVGCDYGYALHYLLIKSGDQGDK